MNTQANVDPAEIEKFQAVASRWWDPQSEFKALHDINPLRVDYIERHSGGLDGKRVVDIGCGGGILAEAMAVGNAGAGGAQNDILEGLGELCRHHGDATDPLSDTCVHLNGTHGDDRGERPVYGTRSSMLLELETGFKAGRLLHADGAPCVTSYEDLSSLIRDLGRRPASVGQGALMRTAG